MIAVAKATAPAQPAASTRTSARPARLGLGNQARLRQLAPAAPLEEATRETDGGAEAPAQDAGAQDAGAPASDGADGGEPAQQPPGGTACTCAVASGPTYTPGAKKLPVTVGGGRRSTEFRMSASFVNDPAKGKLPSCCHVRQYMRWDKALEQSFHGPPPQFPGNAKAGDWIEDRDDKDTRYGHRSGKHSAPAGNCEDEYRTGAKQDMANGNVYCGHDQPFVPSSTLGTYDFQLKVLDSAAAEIAASSIVTADWN